MSVYSVDAEARPGTPAGLLRCRPEERREVLAALAPAERAALLEELIAERAAAALGIDRAALDPGRPLTAFGLDSLSAVELQGAVEEAAGTPLPLVDLLSGASVHDLARDLAAKLAGTTAETVTRHDENLETDESDENAATGDALRKTASPAADAAAPLTAGQRALWFLERLAPGAGAYNVVVAARARGLDASALGRALELLAARHPALRTVFPTVADEPVQRVLPVEHVRIDFAREDATPWSEGHLGERLAEEAWRPFDLARGPLVRARIFERSSSNEGDERNQRDEQVLLLAVHHIVADFWSLGVLARELGALIGTAGETTAPLPPPVSSFADFARRQERRLAGPEGERLWSFWCQELAGAREPVPDLDLPTDRRRPPVATWRGLSHGTGFPADLVFALRRLGSSEGATLFTVLAAAWQVQLGRYAGQEDFAVGSPTSGRGAPEWAGVVGYFVNPVALRADLAGEPTFHQLLARTGRTVLAALTHAGLPAPLLVERLRPVRDPARPPLYQVMLTLEQRRPGDDPGLAAFALGEEGARIRVGGIELESIALPERRAQFELSLSAAELPAGGLGLSLEANADLFDAATTERMLGHLRALLESAVARPDRPLAELPLLTTAERAQLADEWSATAAPSGPTSALPLHELVAARAQRTPDAVAIVAETAGVASGSDAGDVHLTYSELMARADALARRLRLAGVGGPPPGSPAVAGDDTSTGNGGPGPLDAVERPVALLVERSTDLVVGALGILAAGGVYLPVDPEHAEARLHLLLEDSRAAALVTQERLAARLPEVGVPVLLVEGTTGAGEETGSTSSPPQQFRVLPEQLAYLIYTSGSTGRPKGVAVTHAAAVEHCLTWARAYRLDERDRVLQFPSAGFDAAVEQIFSALLSGASLVLRGPAPWGPREMARRLAELDVSVADVPTAFFARWVEDASDLGPAPPALRLIGISGEELRAETARRLGRTPLAEVPVLNCYGPTETVVSATLHAVDPREAEQAPVPIGRALPGRVARVLARAPGGAGQPQPMGVPGELCLGGVLARGYLGRPDWTAERFVPDPWSLPGDLGGASGARQTDPGGAPGARLYRTGDLVRRRPDGLLEFLGRIDDQVKVRGFRVEPGEVETALTAHPAVREAAVLALPVGEDADGGADADLRLVAFVVVATGLSPIAPTMPTTPTPPIAEGVAPVARHEAPAIPGAALAFGEAKREALADRSRWHGVTDPPLAAEPRPLDSEGLRAFLAARLPDYMIPAAWLALPALPLNVSGKVDRAALARRAAEARAFDGGREAGEAPRTPEEELLAGLWAALLGRERVGVHDDFFALGGHSLLATRLVAQVSRLFGVDLPVSAVFATPTVAALAGRIAAASRTEAAPPVRSLPGRAAAAALPLSFAQRRLWFLDRLEPGTAAYNVPGAVRLAGPLDVRALAAALAEIVRRHGVLRTVYLLADGEPMQRVEAPPATPPAVPIVDLSGLPRVARGAEAARRSRAEFLRPFNLERGPVLRTVLLRLAPSEGGPAEDPAEHLLVATFHHIAVDGWSLGLFLDELADLYPALATPAVLAQLIPPMPSMPLPTPPPLPVQYADFAAWQSAWMTGDLLARQLGYWRQRLAGIPVLELPVDRPRPAVRDLRGVTRAIFLPEEAAATMSQLARREGTTLFMALLAAFQALLARVTGAAVVPVGSPVANRRRPEVERLIGLFVNTLVLDVRVVDDPSLSILLTRVRQACLSAYAHQDLPFERLVEELQPSRDLGQNPLFQVMFVLEEPLPPRRAGALALEPVRGGSGTAKLDLLLAVSPRPEGGWDVLAEYAAALWDGASVERLLGGFRTLLAGAAATDPAVRISALPLLSEPQRHQALAEWNDTAVDYPVEARLHELVAAQAARTPDAVAVAAEGERLTYGGLMARAERIAALLRSPGGQGPLAADAPLALTRRAVPAPANPSADSIDSAGATRPEVLAAVVRPSELPLLGPECRVGLCLTRRPDLIAAILGILEAGAAYVPLDPAYPQERLELMLADAGAEVLLTESALADRFAFFAGRTVLLDRLDLDRRRGHGASGAHGVPRSRRQDDGGQGGPAVLSRAAQSPAEPVAGPAGRFVSGAVGDDRALAYVIYTSGSTGRPKPVGIEHRSAVTLVRWALGFFPAAELEGVLAATSACFDLSIFEIFVPLAAGGCVILAPNITGLPELSDVSAVTLANAVPSPMAELVGAPLPAGLRTVNLAGEALKPELAARIYAHPQVERVVNLYGPSEDTTYSTVAVVPRDARLVSIGRPLANTWARIVGPHGEPLPAGVAGELVLGGGGLARGYLGRPDLTAERFVPDPFGPAGGPEARNDLGGAPGARTDLGGAPGARLYRTGDRARLLADGQIEFLGRLDQQVKLHGIRIELGEIEAYLEQHPAVRQAVVMLRADGAEDPRLVGYVVPRPGIDEGGEDLPAALAAYLRERLPAIMVPAAWMVLAELPLTPNGKVDRRALPAPARNEAAGAVAPRDATEAKLAAIWSDVLGHERVGIHDDFFALGGHSLLAVRAVFRIREAFGIELPIAAMFHAPTVAALARHLDGAGDLSRDPASLLDPARDPSSVDSAEHIADSTLAAGDRAPLSSAQRRLWFLDRLEPGSVLYNLQVALRLQGSLDETALARALAQILRRHEPLRTVYADADIDGEPFQQVLPPAVPPIARLSLAGLPPSRRVEALAATLDARIEQPFDLRRGPVSRFLLVHCEATDHVLAAAFHHIATDGWSLGLFARELADLYAAFSVGSRGPSPLPDLPLSYRDVAVAERRALAGPALAEQLGFWRRQLAGMPPLALPGDRLRSASPRDRAASGIARRLDLPAGLATALQALGRGEGITPFVVLLGGFAALLARLSGQEDFGVGVPAAGRTRPETQGMIGLFVNTLVLRLPLAGDPAFLDLLRRVRDVAVDAQAHQEVPFDRVVEELQPERRSGVAPLFQVLFTHLGDPAPPLHMPGLAATLLDLEPRAAEFDLTLSTHQWEGSLRGWLSFRSDLFEPATTLRMTGQLATLLAGAAVDPARRLWDLPLLSAAERRQVEAWSEPAPAVAAKAGTLHALFEERVRLAPDAPALFTGDGTVSFAELEARANRLAHHLIALGITPEAPVGVVLERTPELPTTLLAVLKSGGAYLPLDPSYPPERMRQVLADAGAAVVVSRGELAARLPPGRTAEQPAPTRVLLDRDAEAIAARSAAPPDVEVDPAALAYVIYTSGSTGRPKGVGVAHGSYVAHLDGSWPAYGIGPGDRTLLFVSPGFDGSIEQIVVTLTAGAALVIAGAERWSAREMTRQIGELGLTCIDLTTAYWHRWASDTGEAESVAPLRTVLIGGEEALAAKARLWARSPLAAVTLLNTYGPTEAVVYATSYPVRSEDGDAAAVPIGRPLAGHSVWVLDRAGNPQPPGVPGEIFLGGPLARGYLERPDLTAERFVPDPGGEGARQDSGDALGARLYRTGDRGRYRTDGNLEFLGRIDEQVKVRGFRVEPGEVEAVLTRHPLVREAAVLAVPGPDGDHRLAAWVVSADEGRAADLPALLRAALSESLPDYMVPAAWVTLPALPLSAHGKVDRGALPPPGPRRLDEETGSAALAGQAANPQAELLAGLFAELLGRERVGARDGFFDLGGHSLLATQLVSRVRAVFGVELPLAAVFDDPTPAGLADRVALARRIATGGAGEPPPLVREPGAPAPLSFSQQRLWFLQQLEPDDAYHVPGALRLRGPLREDVLARTLAEIVRRHEALRTVFRQEDERPLEKSAPVQVVLPPASLPLPVADLSALDLARRSAEAARLLDLEAGRPFDLAAGPLVRVLLVRLGDPGAGDERLLSVVMHHITSDAWSLGVLLRELGALYAAFAAGRPSPLPELALQFPDFARWQRRWLAGEVLERELAHWREALAGAPESLELPYDRAPVPGAGNPGGRVPFDLPADLYAGLTALARREGWTAFMALLAGFGALLARYGGQEDLVVGSPIANRGRLELEGPIGFFTNTLPLRLDLAGDPAFRAFGRRVRATALDAYAHQDLPFEKLVEELAPDRHLGRNPLFQAMLVLQRAPAPPALPGVEAELVDVATATAKFDLTLMLVEDGGGASGFLEYARDLLEEATVDRLLVHFRTLLAGAVADPAARLSDLPLLTLAERAELAAWGLPHMPAPPPLLIHERVAAQAARTPEATAVVFGTTTKGLGADDSRAAGAAIVADAAGPAELSYRELVGRARALARRLRSLGVGPDVPVGLYLPRSLDAMVAVLGVLEAGGAYLPIDPDYPAERVRLMLEDAAAPVVLTHVGLAAGLPEGTMVLTLDGLGEADIPHARAGTTHGQGARRAAGPSLVAGSSGTVPDHLAYVTYTSGSTGRPKGVAMTHAAISAMVDWQLRTSRTSGGRTLQFTSLSFDVSFQEIFGTWCAGGTLVLVSEDARRDPPALCRLLAAERVERLFLPFVALQQVAAAAIAGTAAITASAANAEVATRGATVAPSASDSGEPGAFPAWLREVMSAGEQLHVTPQVAELFARLPGSALHNHYGPSETHAVTWLALEGEPARWPERPPIGRPVDHARVFLLDRHLRRVPPGLPGEIWVGGGGLARGYLGRPDLTAERFLPDPFDDVPGWRPGARMYRTGDLARVPPGLSTGSDDNDAGMSGNASDAEFLGRADFQVKVRGHRIELPEVEAALARHPAVLQAAVAARGETAGARRLAAYVVLREGVPAPTPGELRAFLAETLPDPMVPAVWARLDSLPLTSSGKLDRRALARLHREEHWGAGDGFVAPRDPAEEILAVIWREVLGIERVGAHDDFFALGGHSLLATQLASRIRAAFGVELPLRRVFEAPTLAGLAAEVTALLAHGQAVGEEGTPTLAATVMAPPTQPIGREPRDRDLPLSFAQERLWFLQRLQPESAAYNIPLVLRAEGRLDPARLAAALARLAARHEALRTVFVERGGAPVQVVLPAAAAFPLPVVALGALPPAAAEAEAARLAAEDAARPFDLERGPLLRALMLELAPVAPPGGTPESPESSGSSGLPASRGWVLLLDMHHIVSDGWSMGVLVREMRALYAGASLPELPVQYADFAVWQRRRLSGETLARQLAWWRERLAGAPAGLELPADHPRPPVHSQRGAEWRFALDTGLLGSVTELARREGATPFMVLAAGLFALLGRLSGERDLSLGSPIANRTHREIEGLIGFFVNTLVLRVDLGRAASFAELVRQVREVSLGAYAHQDVPFEKLVDELQPERDLSCSPLFQVALALQNAPLPEAWLDGVHLTAEEPPGEISKFDLSWALAEADGRLAGVLQYSTDLFEPATAARYARGFAVLLGSLTADPQGRLAEVPLLAEEERHQALYEWSDGTSAAAPSHVLDESLLPCSVGVVGELYVHLDAGGAGALPIAGVRPEPNPGAGRLVPNPFAGEPGSSLLATGKLARRRADGSLDLLGRAENLIRVRRAALPAPEDAAPVAYVAPRNDLERTIAAVWREVLGVERIGVHESFFTAGGTSLKIAILSARLQRALGREIPVVDLFRHPTIEGLARSLDAGAPAPEQQVERQAEGARARTQARRESVRQVQQRVRRVQAGRLDVVRATPGTPGAREDGSGDEAGDGDE